MGQQAGGFKNLKAGFGDKIRGQEGGVRLKIVPFIKKRANFAENSCPGPKQFNIHGDFYPQK
jgi:hypothetical protein